MKTFTYQYKVMLDDVDFMQIVSHVRWLEILHRARTEMAEQFGYPVSKMIREGVGFVVGGIEIQYKRPALFGDVLEIEVRTKEPFDKGGMIEYQARKKGAETTLVAATYRLYCVNVEGHPIPMPDKIKQSFFT